MIGRTVSLWILLALAVVSSGCSTARAMDVVFADFEQNDYAGWTATGTAFGTRPSRGPLRPNQQPIMGYHGVGFINTYNPDDAATGKLVSPLFTIEKPFIAFVLGGGNHPGQTCVNLVVDGVVARSSTARTRTWGDSEWLRPDSWDVRELKGRTAHIEIVDNHKGGWGHVMLDQIVFSDERAPTQLRQPNEIGFGPYRKIYDPSVGETSPWYINDHCIIRDASTGYWHMFGITREEPADAGKEILFAHAVSTTTLTGAWKKLPPALRADTTGPSPESHIWAPHVIKHNGIYHMFYHAGAPNNVGKMHLATSTDLTSWTRHPANPLFSDRFDARDPMVLLLDAAAKVPTFVMYYCLSPEDDDDGRVDDAVAYRTSNDLVHWSDKKYAYRTVRTTSGGGETESPFVVRRGGYYYLFIGPRGNYSTTTVYRSTSPFHWGDTQLVGFVDSHAAEVIKDIDGKWYVSHAGWGQGGVYLAPLDWSGGNPPNGVGSWREY